MTPMFIAIVILAALGILQLFRLEDLRWRVKKLENVAKEDEAILTEENFAKPFPWPLGEK